MAANQYQLTLGSVTVAQGVFTSLYTITPYLDGVPGSWGGADTITISSTGGQIAATPPGGDLAWNEDGQTIGNNTASVIVTPDPANDYFNFKVKWASSGTKSIVYTNGQAWTNPDNTSVEVTPSGNSSRGSSLAKIW